MSQSLAVGNPVARPAAAHERVATLDPRRALQLALGAMSLLDRRPCRSGVAHVRPRFPRNTRRQRRGQSRRRGPPHYLVGRRYRSPRGRAERRFRGFPVAARPRHRLAPGRQARPGRIGRLVPGRVVARRGPSGECWPARPAPVNGAPRRGPAVRPARRPTLARRPPHGRDPRPRPRRPVHRRPRRGPPRGAASWLVVWLGLAALALLPASRAIGRTIADATRRWPGWPGPTPTPPAR